MEFVKYDPQKVADNTGWIKWWLILQTMLVIAKYSITKEMPWALVLFPTILVGAMLALGVLIMIISLITIRK